MTRTNRREFMITSARCLAGAALAQAGLRLSGCTSEGGSEGEPKRITLTVQWLETTLDGTRVRLRTYDGIAPGPLLELRAGEALELTVVNELTPYDSSDWNGDHNVPHRLNSTNLHLHGLEIIPHLFDPVGTSDPEADMIAIAPGKSFTYHFDLPRDQPCGLYWYHPHLHGSTAVQAVSGMAGPIIVRGAVDDVPEIAAAREELLVVNDIGLFPSEDDAELWTYEPVQNAVWDTLSSQVYAGGPIEGTPSTTLQGGFSTGDYKLRYYLVNGAPFFKEEHNDAAQEQNDPIPTQLDPPEIQLAPGEVVRIRMLNACSDLLMPMHVEGHPVHLIALDGVNFVEPRTITTEDQATWDGVTTYAPDARSLVLAPANRAEFLIKGAAEGSYDIVQLAADGAQFLVSARKVLARLVVKGDPVDMELPRKLPAPGRETNLFVPGVKIAERREITFSMRTPGMAEPVENAVIGLDFMINGELYDIARIDQTAALDTVDEWTIAVPDSHHGGFEGHPFHIHVNSFEVGSIGGLPQPAGTVMDTIWVAAASEVVFRIKYKQWTGKTVYHCHILPHEDTGMMQNLMLTKRA